MRVTPRPALALALLLAPAAAGALEPRFDHRDQVGLFAEVGAARDTVHVSGGTSATHYRGLVRVGGGFDVTGEGDELLGSVVLRPGPSGDEWLRWGAELRYRGYFGSEQFKTFFDVGLSVPIYPKIAVGPRAGLGAMYDFTRSLGTYLSFSFATAFGQVRVASFELAAGVQARW